MTNAPVKDVGSLMNFIGSSRAAAKTDAPRTESFGDVMSRASGGNANVPDQSRQIESRKDQTPKETDVSKAERPVKEQKTENVREKDPVKTEVSKEAQQAAEEAGKEVVKAIAEKLGISEEEVLQAMEEMGFSLIALFDPAILTQLVLKLTGNQDMTALITDEGLFATVQDLIGQVGIIRENLMQEIHISPEELQNLLQNVNAEENAVPKMEDAVLNAVDHAVTESTAAGEEKTPEKTVEIEIQVNGDTVKASADESGNMVKTLTVTAEGETSTGKEAGQQQGDAKGQSQEAFHTGNPILDSLLQNKVQAAEISAEQPVFFNANTQEIMDQIMDYMKIQLRPGMDQIQMQLHPASLGTVQVRLTSNGGEITAQFQVQNESVKAAIENQIADLKEVLKDQGIKVEAVEVTVESNGFESNLWQGQGREENATSQNGRKNARRINLNDLDALFEDEADQEEILAAKMMEANGNTVDYTA